MNLQIGDRVTIEGVGRDFATVVDVESVEGEKRPTHYLLAQDTLDHDEVDPDKYRRTECNLYRLPVGEDRTVEGCRVHKGELGERKIGLSDRFV